jgi:hypothetical protein
MYVLDPKLQDGKKVPMWNHWAWQGQFLGFSDKHSSLVATVCHLTTGFVSPHFMCFLMISSILFMVMVKET